MGTPGPPGSSLASPQGGTEIRFEADAATDAAADKRCSPRTTGGNHRAVFSLFAEPVSAASFVDIMPCQPDGGLFLITLGDEVDRTYEFEAPAPGTTKEV